MRNLNLDIDNKIAKYYLLIWKKLFKEFLGWTEKETIDWAEKTGKRENLANPDDLIYHQSPQYWAIHTLLPDTLKNELPPLELIDLKSRLLDALEDETGFFPSEETNWKPFREKIEHILSEYNEKLPERLY
jgi:hypothetical protein